MSDTKPSSSNYKQYGTTMNEQQSHQTRMAQQHQQDTSLPPPPLLAPHTMYTAGYNARVEVSTVTNYTYYWQWTEETDIAFQEVYDKAMNPPLSSCYGQNNTKDMVFVTRWGYGLTSNIRDTTDVMFVALSRNKPMVHAGSRNCSKLDEDPFMLCLYEPFSSCQGVVDQAGLDSIWFPDLHEQKIDSMFNALWDTMLKHGLHAVQTTTTTRTLHDEDDGGQEGHVSSTSVTNPSFFDASWDQKLAVLKTLLVRQTWYKPSAIVLERVSELEQQLLNVSVPTTETSPTTYLPMLTVHIRRTDKVTDDGKVFQQELRRRDVQTLVAIRGLIRAAERLSGGIQFQSIFLICDEPELFSDEALEYLSSSVLNPNKPKVIFNNYIPNMLANHEGYNNSGHGGLTKEEHVIMDREIVADMAFAGKHSSYIVGYGRSGISQLISQLIGAKYRVCPSTISLFEDDPVLLESLSETGDWSWLLNK